MRTGTNYLDFENPLPDKQGRLDTTHVFEGAYSLLLPANATQSPALTLDIPRRRKQKDLRVYTTVRFFMPHPSRAFLALKYYRNQQLLDEQYASLSTYKTGANEWNHAFLAEAILPGKAGRVEAYIWKPGHNAPLWLDDMELVAY